MDHDAERHTNVVLGLSRNKVTIDEPFLKENRIVIDLDEPDVDVVSHFEVEAAAEYHGEVVRRD